jgi:hypothetical protein
MIRKNPLDLGPGTRFRICEKTKGKTVTTGSLHTRGMGNQASFVGAMGISRTRMLTGNEEFLLETENEQSPVFVFSQAQLA